MDLRTRRQSVKKLIVGDSRTLAVVAAGALLYLLLFVAFGGQRILPSKQSISARFPRKLWQSWRNDALSFEARDSERARSWLSQNPSMRHEVLTDASGLAYVQDVFGPTGLNRPDIVETYRSLNAKIIQADLIRYIIMYAEGGIWADVDVEALKPFEQFIPARFHEKELNMIIGVETDEPTFKDHPILGSKAQSFCQWVFVCKPRHPVMLRLIDNILIWLKDLAKKQGKDISQITLNFDEVLSGTGPSAFTTAILAEMSRTTGRDVSWTDFHALHESKAIGGVLVLTAEAFAAGTMHSHSGSHQGAGALVKHHFHASGWTKSHERFKHPVYGEVEKCNWDPECVELWDANTAAFNALSGEDQTRVIALKNADEKREAERKAQQEAQLALLSPVEGPSQLPFGPPMAGDVKVEGGPSVADDKISDDSTAPVKEPEGKQEIR